MDEEPAGSRTWIVLPETPEQSGWGPLTFRCHHLEQDGYCVAIERGTGPVTLRLSGTALTSSALAYTLRPAATAESPAVPPRAEIKPALVRAIPGDIPPRATRRTARTPAEALGHDGHWYPVIVIGWARDRYGRWTVDIDGLPEKPTWTGTYIYNAAKLRPATEGGNGG